MEGNPPTDSEHHNSSYHSFGHSKLRAWSLTKNCYLTYNKVAVFYFWPLASITEGVAFVIVNCHL